MKQNLQSMTLIIPTFNRPAFLARLMKYYASKKTQIQFLILDSSDKETIEINKQASSVLGQQVRYVTFPSTLPVATKLLEGLKLVDTPFCAFCADDDLVFVEGLTQALTFLQDHPDFVCVDGIYLNFNPVGHNMHLVVEYATKGINAEDPGARIFKLCQKYESLFYGAFRTQHALNIFSGVVKNSSLHYQELFQATSALLIGKSNRLPIFYAARQHCNPADQQRDKWQTYYWFADNTKEFLEHYLIYREELWNFYQNHTLEKKHEKKDFFQFLDLAHAMYFSMGCPPEYFHNRLEAYWPQDKFQKSNAYKDNICNQLKSSSRRTRETWVQNAAKWIPNQIFSWHSKRDVRKLNNEIQNKTKMNWNCLLSKDLRWLASVDIFRNAYYELCEYMNENN